MRVIVQNRCGVPVRCIVTRTEKPTAYHVFFMGTNGLRTNTRGAFVPTPGEELFDAVIPGHGLRHRMIVADVPSGTKVHAYDHFDCRWKAARDRFNDIVITIKDLRN